MPRYEIFTSDELPANVKRELAGEITDIHCDLTGAPPSFVRVVFFPVGDSNCFVAGEPQKDASIRGIIREGRSRENIAELLHGLGDAMHRATGVPKSEILVSLGQRPGWQVMEAGRVLPSPGQEGDWLEAGKDDPVAP